MSPSDSPDDRRPPASGTDAATSSRIGLAVRDVINATALATGPVFFATFVRDLARALDVSDAFVAECTDSSKTRVRTLAFWSGDRFVDNVVYSLAGTECEASRGQAQHYLGVPLRNASGEVLGHLAVLDHRPIEGDGFKRAVLRTCAVWASMELERQHAADQIAAQKEEISRLMSQIERDGAYVREIIGAESDASRAIERPAVSGSGTLEEVERAYILATLVQTGWVIEGPRGAARILDMHPNTLRSRLKKLGLERARPGLPPVEGV